jgi:hypothetical protein
MAQGYLASRSAQPYHWQTAPGEDQRREVVAPGKENVWICELGRRDSDGIFEDFILGISQARLVFEGLRVRYRSSSQGLLDFGWRGPLRQDGRIIPLRGYKRYDNPLCPGRFPYGTHHHPPWEPATETRLAAVV